MIVAVVGVGRWLQRRLARREKKKDGVQFQVPDIVFYSEYETGQLLTMFVVNNNATILLKYSLYFITILSKKF